MNTRAVLIGIAAALAVLLLAALAWLALNPRVSGGAAAVRPGSTATASNPALDVRFSYDSGRFRPAPYDPRAEYPLQLDGDGFSFYGKRIRGAGALLAKDPGGMLYDFVGSEHLESFVQYYNLIPAGEPLYEDAEIAGRLGLHQQAQYDFGRDSLWPYYFPAQFQETPPPASAFIEGWAVFTEQDLFFFQAVGVKPLTPEQRVACQQVMDSLQFNAVLGGAEPAAEQPAAAGDSLPEIESE